MWRCSRGGITWMPAFVANVAILAVASVVAPSGAVGLGLDARISAAMGLHHAMSNGAAAQAWGQQGMCPSFHQIHGPCGNTSVRGRFGAIVCLCDPSMPLRVGGLWHLFVDGAGSQPGWYWHFTSSDTLHWANVSNDNTTNTFTGWTGAATVTPEGAIVALNPNGDGCGDDVSPCGIGRSVALSSAMTEWSVSIYGNPASEVIAKPAGVTGGFRDVTRAFEIDGAWFVLVGTGCKAVNATCKPGELGGQVRVYRATDAMLAAFEPEGGVLWATSTSLGHIQKGLRGQVLAWNSTSVPEEFHECPDVYRLSNDSNDWLLAGSFMPSHNARYWVGTMEIPPGERLPKFIPRTSWLWDFGSYYAPRTGAAGDGGRRVLFGWSGWMSNKYNGIGFGGVCDPDYHNLPRDVSVLGDDGYMNVSPVQELVELRVPGSMASGPTQLGRGVAVDAVLRCNAPPRAGVHHGAIVGMDVLASTDRTRYFRLSIDLGTKELVANSSTFLPAANQTKTGDAPAGVNHAPLPPTTALFPLELRVVVDGLMVEAYFNNRTALTSMLPAPPGWISGDPSDLSVFKVAEPGDAAPVCTLETYRLSL